MGETSPNVGPEGLCTCPPVNNEVRTQRTSYIIIKVTVIGKETKMEGGGDDDSIPACRGTILMHLPPLGLGQKPL